MGTLIGGDNSWGLFAILVLTAACGVYLEQSFKWASKVTGYVLVLLGTMALSNLNVIPTGAPAYDFVWDYIVPLSIPLLLFNADIRRIGKDSGRLMILYLLSGLGTLAGAFAAYRLLRDRVAGLGYAVPMMVGTYTGGSVNLAAMADTYRAPGDLVSSCVVADNLIMALYLFALAATAESRFFLRHFRHLGEGGAIGAGGEESSWLERPVALKNVILSIALSLSIVAVSVAVADRFAALIPTGSFCLVLLNGLLGNKYLIMTTVSVLVATLFPRSVGRMPGAQETGLFLIHIFFAVIGVSASVRLIVSQAPLLFLFCAIIVAFNMAFSFVSGKLLRFSLEEIIIASNANIGGPTTAAAMAISKGWVELIVPAILVGTFGYVLGNYYGIFAGACIGL